MRPTLADLQAAINPIIDGWNEALSQVVEDESEIGPFLHTAADTHWSAWWLERAEAEIEAMSPKVEAYSSRDLEMLGRWMADMLGAKLPAGMEHAELACLFYAAGKMARLMGAVMDGRSPDDDSYHDARIYLGMAERIRAVGAWPG